LSVLLEKGSDLEREVIILAQQRAEKKHLQLKVKIVKNEALKMSRRKKHITDAATLLSRRIIEQCLQLSVASNLLKGNDFVVQSYDQNSGGKDTMKKEKERERVQGDSVLGFDFNPDPDPDPHTDPLDSDLDLDLDLESVWCTRHIDRAEKAKQFSSRMKKYLTK
jgi:hypothetical protein